MIAVLTTSTFLVAVLLYAAASALFFMDVVRSPSRHGKPGATTNSGFASKADSQKSAPKGRTLTAPHLLFAGAIAHAAHVTLASFVAKVCPIHSVHFMLSVAALLAIFIYIPARRRFRIEALGLLVAPLGLVFVIGTFLLGRPEPETKASPAFIALHVLSNLLGVALFLLAGGAATLYLVQDNRLKTKKHPIGRTFGALETLDLAVHRFLIAAFPMVTLGIVTGTYWARKLETGAPDEVMRAIFGYATWLLIAGVLLLRAAAGMRGRRAAYGTILGLGCALTVLVIYLVRPGSATEPPSNPTSGATGTTSHVEHRRGATHQLSAPQKWRESAT